MKYLERKLGWMDAEMDEQGLPRRGEG